MNLLNRNGLLLDVVSELQLDDFSFNFFRRSFDRSALHHLLNDLAFFLYNPLLELFKRFDVRFAGLQLDP
ncbi:hypothetical protein D3C81_1656980 [compost metagenome]